MSPQPIIYRSTYPPKPTVNTSIFTHLFRDSDVYPPARPAFIDAATGCSITRGDLKRNVLALSDGLRNQPIVPVEGGRRPLRRGDVVMILSPNSLSWPVALFGAVAAGLAITLASSSLTPRELSWQWLDSRPQLLFVSRSHVAVARAMFQIIGVSEAEAEMRTWVMDDIWSSTPSRATTDCNWLGTLFGDPGASEERFDGTGADETVYICYSSGTTSSHRGAGSVISMAWSVFESIKRANDVTLAILPFYHIFGLIGHLHHSFYIGAPTVIMTQGETDLPLPLIGMGGEHAQVNALSP
ncbi:hypothetical protein CC1G_05610 [Coprinopsis cinerea okayama7|uniref:AMP-dependent synthetase/ligase domain-containing protein n=1 Tax=Coprinopsis cinerea (strain Okayama-7 / 130 / ATCC MYA-4618 / FGSC 9003) TaxID=240176 RepID=A8P1M0_COPC7|nr:hypothetical protein CC1G_05610 [Coprinopsis cinerea okayama7\|eukprot:XP_001838129.1 hypothetical protein CC1G_05610 [Coprinopsis cinerea okayama7\